MGWTPRRPVLPQPGIPARLPARAPVRAGAARRVAYPRHQNVSCPTSEQTEIEAFFRGDVTEVEAYLRVVNVAHDLPPAQALRAVEELLQHATSEDDIALVAAGALEPLVELHHRALEPELEEALMPNPRLRAAFRSVTTVGLPEDVRARLDGIG